MNRLALLLTLTAVLFFTGAVWAMGRKGRLTYDDGLVLVGLFLFWQCFHVFEVSKSNVRQGKSLGWTLPFDLALLAIGAYGIYISTDWLVHWISTSVHRVHQREVSRLVERLADGAAERDAGGLLQLARAAGNGLCLAGRRCHVSIPLCLGIYALYHTMAMPPFFHVAMFILLGATLVHFFFVAVLGRLPRFAGWALVAAYGFFLWKGLLG